MPDVLVAGVDSCRSGWVAVVLEDGVFSDAVHATAITDVVKVLSEVSVLGVDIPIGIDGPYPRQADIAARQFVGRRRSSVFKTPPREVFEAPSHREANESAKSLIGVGISRQTFGLAAKILEVDVVVSRDQRIVEVHPEVSFRAMADRELQHGKKSWNGMRQRERLLQDVGIFIPTELPIPDSVAADDVLDASAAAWSALRVAAGTAQRLPAELTSPNESIIQY